MLEHARSKLGFLAALAVGAVPASAHHSVIANFDRGTTIELSGTIEAVHIRNPHSQYVLRADGADGSAVEWLIEWADKNALTRRGVDLERIKVGDRLTITVWPSRQLEHVGYFIQAVLPDGAIYRDCGFLEFRRAVVESTEFDCKDARGRQ